MDVQSVRTWAAAIVMAAAAIGPGLAIGFLAHSAMQALGRNPESRGAIMTNMILAIAFCEAIAIYCLIVAIIMLLIVV